MDGGGLRRRGPGGACLKAAMWTPADRAPDEPDPIEAAIAMATAIERVEERRDLPFSDTLEVSKNELGSITVTRARSEGP